nr:MAG TPA: hypothetical protein [Caudoviricetes sp.]
MSIRTNTLRAIIFLLKKHKDKMKKNIRFQKLNIM